MNNMRFVFTLLVCSVVVLCRGQSSTDSLRLELVNSTDAERIPILIALADELFYSESEEARAYAKEALSLCEEFNDSKQKLTALNVIGITYDIEGLKDSSKFYFTSFYHESVNQQNYNRASAALNNLGMWHWNSGLFDEALEYYFKSARIADSLETNSLLLSKIYNNIGLIHQELNDFNKAIKYNMEALKLREKENDKRGMTHSYNNLGICHISLGERDSAEFYYRKGLALALEEKNYTSITNIQQNLGVLEMERGNYSKAVSYIKESFSYDQNSLSNLLGYSSLCEIYYKQGLATKSIEAGLKALSFAEETDSFGHLEDIYYNLSKAYSLKNDGTKAVQYLELWNVLRDTIFSRQSTKIYSELEILYESEKKQQQIALQNSQLSKQEAELERNQILQIASAFALILLVSLGLLQRNRLKKKQELALKEAEVLVKEAEINVAISSQEKERARYARDLHDGFGQMISILNVNIKTLENGAKPKERQKVFESSEKVIEDMYAELKNICFDLMPQTLIKHGLESALQEFSGRINQTGKVQVELIVFGVNERLSELQEISLYRISQEWVNNILKYADAQKITLQITKDEEEITLLIEDDGMGFDKRLLTSGKGNGWKNLNTRANLIKGELELETKDGVRGNVLILNASIITTLVGAEASIIE